MSSVSLMPVPAEQSEPTCANCGAALVADQRYCLTCGQPCSPVRLAFLDVLQTEHARAGAPAWPTDGVHEVSGVAYAPIPQGGGANAWLRRNAGLMGLLAVLVLCLITGLLLGHWVTQGKTQSGPQIVKVEGLSGVAAAAAPSTSTAATAGAATSSAAKSAAAKEAAAESKAAAKETKAEKAPPPAPVKASPAKLQKLSTSTGRKHTEEINALGDQPIETG